MQRVTVLTEQGMSFEGQGEVVFDAGEGALIVYAPDGGYIDFNWAHVVFYAVIPVDEEEGEEDEK